MVFDCARGAVYDGRAGGVGAGDVVGCVEPDCAVGAWWDYSDVVGVYCDWLKGDTPIPATVGWGT